MTSIRTSGNHLAGPDVHGPLHGRTDSEEHELPRQGDGRATGTAGTEKGRTQQGNPLGCLPHEASDALVQSGRSRYATTSTKQAPVKTVATLCWLRRDQNSTGEVLLDAHTPGPARAARQKPLARKPASPSRRPASPPRYNAIRYLGWPSSLLQGNIEYCKSMTL